MDLTLAKEFVGDSEAEAVEKAAKFFGVSAAQLELRTLPSNLGVSGLGSRVVVLASVKGERGERADRGDRGEQRDRGEWRDRGDRGGRGGRRDRGDRGNHGDRSDRGERDDAALEKLAHESAAEVTKTGEPVLLRPMNSKERWIIHNVVNETAGLRSESVGEGRMRRVKIEPE